MSGSPVKSKRHALLGALFCAAAERGISQEQVRQEIAHGVIGKRLSAASDVEITRVLEHISGGTRRRGDAGTRGKSGQKPTGTDKNRQGATKRQYSSTIAGLRNEICDLARARWGLNGGQGSTGTDTETRGRGDWETALNNLCKKFGVSHFRFLDVAHGKAVKERLLQWDSNGSTK